MNYDKTEATSKQFWTMEKNFKFLEALKLYGFSIDKVHEHVGTRNKTQIHNHFQYLKTKLLKLNTTLEQFVQNMDPFRFIENLIV